MNRLAPIAYFVIVCASMGCAASLDDPAAFDLEAACDVPQIRTNISVVFDAHCAGSDCHDDVAPRQDLDLLTDTVGDPLEDRVIAQNASGGACSGEPLVVTGTGSATGNLDASYLYTKVRVDGGGDIARCGLRMPFGASMPAARISCIRDWILCLDPMTAAGIDCE